MLQELVARAATSAAYSETFVIVALLFVVSIPFLLLFHLVPRKEADPRMSITAEPEDGEPA